MEFWNSIIYCTFLIILTTSRIEGASSQNGTYDWSYFQFGTTLMDVAEAGNWTYPGLGYADFVFAKMDPQGNITQSIMFGSNKTDKASCMLMKKEVDNSLTFYLGGQTSGNVFGSQPSGTDGVVVSVKDSDFSFLWTMQTLDNGYSSFAKMSFDATNDTLLYAIGSTDVTWISFGVAPVSGSRDVWVVKLNRHTGAMISMVAFGSDMDDDGIDIAVDAQGTVYGIGSTYGDITEFGLTSLGGSDSVLFSMDSQGNFNWVQFISTSGYDDLLALALNPDFSIIYAVGGTTSNMSSNGTEIPLVTGNGYDYQSVLAKISAATGDVLDVSLATTTGGGVTFNDIITDSSGRMYVAGYLNGEDFLGVTRDAVSYDFDIVFVIYASNGSMDYVAILGTTWDDSALSIYLQSNNTVWLSGYTGGDFGSTNYGSVDMVILKAVPQNAGEENSSNGDNKQSAVVIIAVVCVVPILGLASLFGFLLIRRRRRRAVLNALVGEQPSQTTSSLYQQPRGSGTNYAAMIPVRVSEYEDFPSKGSNGSGNSAENSGSTQGSALATDKLTQMLSLRNDWLINYDELLLEKKIGAGAFGEVFRGSWRGIPVAVKKMIQSDAETEKLAIEDFLTEASLMKKLRPHPNITLLLGVCSSPLCIVTEFVSNGSLLSWLQSNKPMDNDMKISIIRGIAAGMLHLHSEGVIHRDLAARNILITSSWKPKVSDFGLSRVSLDNKTNKTEASIGPIKWMAPEALLDKVYNTRTDVWSFGVVIYEVLVRKNPYYNHDAMQVGTQVALGKLNLLDEIQKEGEVGSYPGVLMSLMKQCLRYNAVERPEFQQIIENMDTELNPASSEFVE